MKKSRKILTLVLAVALLLGNTLTVNANSWCCPGAADKQIEYGMHIHDGYDLHPYYVMKCYGCGKEVCHCCPTC